jgi:hypothetical protein
VPDVPPLPVPAVAGALAPPELEPVPAGELLLEAEDGVVDVPLDEALEVPLAVTPVAPVEPVVPVVAGLAATSLVGTVSGGAPEVSPAVEPPPPQAATARVTSPAASSVRIRDLAGIVMRLRGGQESSGSIRLPQCGQSFRSFWHS